MDTSLLVTIHAVRLVAHWKIQPGFLINNTLVMRERAESIQSMIGTHAALAEARPNPILLVARRDDRVVGAAAAGTTVPTHFFCDGFIRCKQIKSQRVRHGIYFFDNHIKVVVSQDRQYRSEDFLLT